MNERRLRQGPTGPDGQDNARSGSRARFGILAVRSGSQAAFGILAARFGSQAGFGILAVIIMIGLAGIAGAIISQLTATGNLGEVQSTQADMAWHNAESGLRLIGAEYRQQVVNLPASGRNAPLAANQLLESYHGAAFDMPATPAGSGGSFALTVLPYWLSVTADAAAGSATLNARFPGGPPWLDTGVFPALVTTLPTSAAGGRLKLGGKTHLYRYLGTPAVATGPLVLNLDPADPL